MARPAIIPELKSSLIIETKIENELTKDSQDPQVSKDSKAEEAVKETHSLKKEESSKKAVKETAQVPKEKRPSERAAIGPLLSSGLIKQLKEEEHQQEQKKEKEETKLEHAEKMEDQDEVGLAEKSGLVIRKRKKANKPAVIKVSIPLSKFHSISEEISIFAFGRPITSLSSNFYKCNYY